MSKSTAKNRTYVICFNQRRSADKCRTCKKPIPQDTPAWSPYWGGGHYHLECDAFPALPPRSSLPEENRCPRCDRWFMKEPTSPGCSRCMLRERLGMVAS